MYVRLVISALLLAGPAMQAMAQDAPEPSTVTVTLTTTGTDCIVPPPPGTTDPPPPPPDTTGPPPPPPDTTDPPPPPPPDTTDPPPPPPPDTTDPPPPPPPDTTDPPPPPPPDTTDPPPPPPPDTTDPPPPPPPDTTDPPPPPPPDTTDPPPPPPPDTTDPPPPPPPDTTDPPPPPPPDTTDPPPPPPDTTGPPPPPDTTGPPPPPPSGTGEPDPCEPIIPLPGAKLRRRAEGDDGAPACEAGAEYVIYPKDGADAAAAASVLALLSTMVVPTSIVTSDLTGYGVLYWRAVLNNDQAGLVAKNPAVATVHKPCGEGDDSCFDPTAEGLARQASAPDELVAVGQFPGQDFAWYRGSYVYHERAGQDIDLYILDTGARVTHKDFNQGYNLAQNTRFIHTNPAVESAEDDGATGSNHGTCMLSRASGHLMGVAKNVNAVVVRVPRLRRDVEYYIDGLKQILLDVGDGKKAVLSMSIYWPRFKDTGAPMWTNPDGSDGYDGIRRTMGVLLGLLIKKGVLPVVGSGNAGRSSMDGIPATLADPNGAGYLPELLVVGATNPKGDTMWIGTNRDAGKSLPHVYMAGDGIKCADGIDDTTYRGATGTSPATAATAGLAAYFLSLGGLGPFEGVDIDSPADLRAYLLKLAYPRGGDNSLNFIYNGVRPSDAGTNNDGPTCQIRARQVNGEGDLPDFEDCGPPTTMTTTTTNPPADPTDPPPPPPPEREYKCMPYLGDREGKQCTCEPQGCTIGDRDCMVTIAVKGEEGCDDQCNGCKPKREPFGKRSSRVRRVL